MDVVRLQLSCWRDISDQCHLSRVITAAAPLHPVRVHPVVVGLPSKGNDCPSRCGCTSIPGSRNASFLRLPHFRFVLVETASRTSGIRQLVSPSCASGCLTSHKLAAILRLARDPHELCEPLKCFPHFLARPLTIILRFCLPLQIDMPDIPYSADALFSRTWARSL